MRYDNGLRVLTVICTVYTVFYVLKIDNSYLDFADGNYLYISMRVMQGLTPYNDITAPHPPVLFYLGAGLLKADLSVWPIRLFLLFLKLCSTLILYLVAVKVFRDWKMGVVCGGLFLVLPVGFRMAWMWTPEQLLVPLTLLSLYLLLCEKPNYALVGVVSAVMLFTKYTSLPIVATILIYVFSCRRVGFQRYFLPFMLTCEIGLALSWFIIGPQFIFDTVLLQTMDVRSVAWLFERVSILLSIESVAVVFAMFGVLYCLRTVKGYRLPALFLTVSVGMILFTVKAGTNENVFVTAEAFIALFAGYFTVTLVKEHAKTAGKIGVIGMAFILLFNSPMMMNMETYTRNNAETVEAVTEHIHMYSDVGDEIFAPGHYAFTSERVLSGEYSSTYAWKLRHDAGDVSTSVFVIYLVAQIRQGNIKVAVLDGGENPKVLEAFNERYTVVYTGAASPDTVRVLIPTEQRSQLLEPDEAR